MKKTMIYLPEETHEGLRRLAFEEKTSIAELIRRAIDIVYGEDIEDIRDMEEELARYRAEPGHAISAMQVAGVPKRGCTSASFRRARLPSWIGLGSRSESGGTTACAASTASATAGRPARRRVC